MRLNVKPVYGYGWRTEQSSVEVPARFHMDVLALENRMVGAPIERSHSLSGLWVELTMRTLGPNPSFNVRCFDTEQEARDGVGPARLTGFAELSPIP